MASMRRYLFGTLALSLTLLRETALTIISRQADAKINYNSTLLGDLAPYAYGKPGRLSSQTAFLAIPHMLQKVVPVLSIPSSQWPCTDVTKLYHSVDDGDVAFTINIDRTSTKFAEGPQLFDKVRVFLPCIPAIAFSKFPPHNAGRGSPGHRPLL